MLQLYNGNDDDTDTHGSGPQEVLAGPRLRRPALFLWCCAPAALSTGSSAVRIDEVPFFPRTNTSAPCVPRRVMNYWGVPVTPDEIAREIFSRTPEAP